MYNTVKRGFLTQVWALCNMVPLKSSKQFVGFTVTLVKIIVKTP